jgi:hypothetical protein
MDPQRFPISQSLDPMSKLCPMAKRIRVADRIKFAITILVYLHGPNTITVVFKVEEGGKRVSLRVM